MAKQNNTTRKKPTRKTLEELTLMDDYMFAQVMMNVENMKPFLERILNIKIADIQFFEKQKTEKEGYDSRGVRFDLYVVDENRTIYNVEVQTTDKKNLPKRMRYYQSIIDISTTPEGKDYKYLRKSFIIFVCSYDPFGRNRLIYSFENTCREDKDLLLNDEAYKVVLNIKGEEGDISDDLREAIVYLDSGKVTGTYSKKLDDDVKAIKASEDRRREYMLLSLRDNELREEGREEGIEEGRKKEREKAIGNGVALLLGVGQCMEEALRKVGEMYGIKPEEAEGYYLKSLDEDPEAQAMEEAEE